MTYEELEARLAEWAKDRPEVRAVITVGSRARGTADRWSDLDVLILTTDRTALAADPSWINTFGEAWLTYKDEANPGDPEWFVLFDGGLKFDAVLLDVDDPSLDLDALLAKLPYQGVSHAARKCYSTAPVSRVRSRRNRLMSPSRLRQRIRACGHGFLLEA